MIQEAILTGFTGLNNVNSPSTAPPTSLAECVNVDITDTGMLKKRYGYKKVYNGICHSLYFDKHSGRIFFREDDELKEFNSDYSSTTLSDNLTNNRCQYLSLNGLVYFTDGVDTGIITTTSVETWGIIPPPKPVVIEYSGNLPYIMHASNAVYQLAYTYVDDNGNESGASDVTTISLKQGGMLISLTLSLDPRVVKNRIYISGMNGKVLYFAHEVDNGVNIVYYKNNTLDLNIPLRTFGLQPPPAGQLIEYYNGRIYIAKDNIIYLSRPYQYELFNYLEFLQYDEAITMLKAVSGGLYVGTANKVYFISGNYPQVTNNKVYEFGVVYGTPARKLDTIQSGQQISEYVWFITEQGICVGNSNGSVVNISNGTYGFNVSKEGFGYIIEKDGYMQYMSLLFDATLETKNIYQTNSVGIILIPKIFIGNNDAIADIVLPRFK